MKVNRYRHLFSIGGERILYSNYRQWGFLPHITRDFFRVSLISLCLKTFRGVTRSKSILGGPIYFYRLEIVNKRNGIYLRLLFCRRVKQHLAAAERPAD